MNTTACTDILKWAKLSPRWRCAAGNILSLGEKQRVQIARLIYHRPRYAILDECSSAISTEMEQRLYRIVRELGITYITIAQ